MPKVTLYIDDELAGALDDLKVALKRSGVTLSQLFAAVLKDQVKKSKKLK